MEGAEVEVVNQCTRYNEGAINKIRCFSKSIADEFVNGGHLLGINFSFIGLVTMIIFIESFRWEIVVMIYFLTMTIYGFDHYYDLKQDKTNHNDRVVYVTRNKRVYPYKITFFCIIFLLLLFVGKVLILSIHLNVCICSHI